MEKNEIINSRSSSCRGVAFETKPHAAPDSQNLSWLRPWNSFSKIVSSSDQMSTGETISHFCDFKLDIEDHHDIELGHNQLLYELDQKPHFPPPPPPPKQVLYARLSVIDHLRLFTVYKRLFLLCLTLNITALILASTTCKFLYATNNPALFSIANILALVLCRSEAFLRIIFWLAVNTFGYSWVPLRLKTMTTSLLQSLGGIHSSCGVSSIAWLVYALALTLNNRSNTKPEIIVVVSFILVLLLLSSLAALPLVRHLHHNVFERTHRFAGWTGLALLWAFIILTVSYDPYTKSYKNDVVLELLKTLEFWMTLVITILIIMPWLTIRRVPIRVSSPSGHASIIKFDGGVEAGLLARISVKPYSEWHAFGIISDNKNEHMTLAGAVGDFTKSLVSDPPSHLWVRKVHFAGLPYLTNMYNRVLFVATGSGVCVFLSFLMQPCKAEVCLLWVTKGVETNFGPEIKEWVSRNDGRVIVHDTAVLGRPNVKEMSVDTAKRFGAEVVIVTSNPKGSKDVVDACKDAGIAAFGPIWDS